MGEYTEFLNQYSEEEQAGESFAEFVRKYLQNKETAKADTPNFYKHFQEVLSEKDLAKLDKVADYFQRYLAMGFEQRVDSAIVTDKQTRRFSFGKLNEWRKKAYIELVDSYAPIKDAVDYTEGIPKDSHHHLCTAFFRPRNGAKTLNIDGYSQFFHHHVDEKIRHKSNDVSF